MSPTTFEYDRATSLDDALEKLRVAHGDGEMIAGGHSLVPLMKFRLSQPKILIDIARIPGLSRIREKEGTIEIGAGTASRRRLVQPAPPAMPGGRRGRPVKSGTSRFATAAPRGQSGACRSVGRLLGGHARPGRRDPPERTEWVARRQSTRFLQGLFTVDLAQDEIIAGVQFVPVRAAAYAKLRQRVTFRDRRRGGCSRGERGRHSLGPHRTDGRRIARDPPRGGRGGARGKALSKGTIDAAAALAGANLSDISSDIHASAEYRRAMIPVFTRRALERALARANP